MSDNNRGRGWGGGRGRGNFRDGGDRDRGREGRGRGNFRDGGGGDRGREGRGRGNFRDGGVGDRGGEVRDSRHRGGHSGGFHQEESLPLGEQFQLQRTSKLKPGNIGNSIDLISNFYKVSVSNQNIYHYDIDIKEVSISKEDKQTPEKFLKKFSVELIKQWTSENEVFQNIRYVYDGWKNLYTPIELNLKNKPVKSDCEFVFENKKRLFKIQIQMTSGHYSIFNLGSVLAWYKNEPKSEISENILQFLEIFLNNVNEPIFPKFKRGYFDVDNLRKVQNKSFLQFTTGFSSGMFRAEFGLALNLHLTTKALLSSNISTLEQLAMQFIGKRPDQLLNTNNEFYEFNKFIRHLKVFTHIGDKKITYLIEKIEKITPVIKTFKDQDGNDITIKDYFKNKHSIDVKPNYPLVKTTGKHAKFLPFELCYLCNKQFLMDNKVENDVEIQKQLLSASTFRPGNYFQKLQTFTSIIGKTDENLWNSFGISFNDKPAQFKGRVLPPPKQKALRRNDQFHRTPSHQLSWIFISFDKKVGENDMKNFASKMVKTASKFGLNFKPQPEVLKQCEISSAQEIINVMKNVHKYRKMSALDIVFIVLPATGVRNLSSTDIYNFIKAFGDRSENNPEIEGGFGFVTQCLKGSNLLEGKSGFLENILLKVNGKVGGVNSIVDPNEINNNIKFDRSKTMVLGIDVNHPSPIEKSSSSVAAAVGSLDHEFSKYTASIRVQPKERDEIIGQLDHMVGELITEYKTKNGKPPENLIVFRDGVSEGQFDKIKSKELPLISNASKKHNPNMKIVLFVVQKRHHTRFVSVQGNNGPNKNSHNVPSGTVVDNSIVDPKYDSFYINSHFSPLGTSKPTKYVLLRDDLKMNSNQLQQLCFYMCHNCVRFRGVIAIPTPIRYADLCAYRSKLHIEGQYKILGNSLNLGKDFENKIIQKLNQWVKIHKNVQNLLYYC